MRQKTNFKTLGMNIEVDVFGSYTFLLLLLLCSIAGLGLLLWKMIKTQSPLFSEADIGQLGNVIIYACAAILPILLIKRLFKMFNLD